MAGGILTQGQVAAINAALEKNYRGGAFLFVRKR